MSGNTRTFFGGRRSWGFVLILLSFFVAVSVFSYNWRDIGRLAAPTNQPPFNLFGPVGAWLMYALLVTVGLGAYLVPLWLFAFGLVMLLSHEEKLWPRACWLLLVVGTISSLMELYVEPATGLCAKINIVDPGGVVARIVTKGILVKWLSSFGAGLMLWTVLIAGGLMLVGIKNLQAAGQRAWHGLLILAGQSQKWLDGKLAEVSDRAENAKATETSTKRRKKSVQEALAKFKKPAVKEEEKAEEEPSPIIEPPQEDLPVEEEEAPPKPSRREKRKEKRKKPPKPKPKKEAPPPEETPPVQLTPPPPAADGEYQLPPISLLDHPPPPDKGGAIEADSQTTAKVLAETLAEFGIECKITNVEKGPVVTRYEVLPAAGVRVERISALSNNLALSLKATSIRVQAPIPGKGVVGIEVPNTVTNVVALREVLEGDDWQADKCALPLVLGKDVTGKDLVADLAKMPHLLIAGATGAGKTVCMNSVLTGLLMARTPDQLRLVLVDPKIVEFSVYNNLPHLVVPVITDPKKVALGLRWAINEMEKRYKIFAKAGVRNIASFNSRPIVKQEELFDEGQDDTKGQDDGIPDRMPYVVVVVDELADLMLADQANIENNVARLAQLSRAVGIHMILSTQRPSVNVITGTIKANFPARIAFQVAQKVDSRTILDTVGADKLLGRGDMLFLPPGTSKVIRAQGCMTSDREVHDVAEYIRQQGGPSYESEIQDKLEKPTTSVDTGDEDELLEQAITIIRETRRASTSSLQRRLRIGYTRAARMMDILEERGVIGPPRGSDPREILIDLDGEIPQNEMDDE